LKGLILCLAIAALYFPEISFSQENGSSRNVVQKIQKRVIQNSPPPAKPKRRRLSAKQVLNPSGSLRMGYFQRDRSYSNDRDFVTSSAWLNMKPRKWKGIGSYFEGNVHGQNLSRHRKSITDLREAYLESSLGPVDIRLGRQITVWGRADKINPTDSLTVRNNSLLAVDDEDQRTGIAALQVITNFDELRLIAISQPEWRDPRLPIPPQAVGVTLENSHPKGAAGQFGLKLDRSGGDIDYSLSYFQGIDRTPDLKLISAGASGVAFELDYKKIHVYGFDTAFNWGSFGLRSEIAYTKTDDVNGTDGFIKNPFWFGVFGVDHTVGENFYVNIQYLYRNIEKWQDPNGIGSPSLAAFESSSQFLSNQQQATQQGASARISYKFWDQQMEIEMSGLMWFAKRDSLFRPKFIYSVNDHWKVLLGGEIYQGPEDTNLGRFRPFSTSYLDIRYHF